MTSETIIWKSKLFPEMYLTKEHLDVLRYAYPSIKQFEPELRKAEAWLFANPERQPKKNWRSFINNWMRNATDFKKLNDKPQYGDAARLTPSDPKALKDIMNRIQKGDES